MPDAGPVCSLPTVAFILQRAAEAAHLLELGTARRAGAGMTVLLAAQPAWALPMARALPTNKCFLHGG